MSSCIRKSLPAKTASQISGKIRNKFEKELLGALPVLRAYAFSLASNKSHVDDLVQETMLKAWDKQDSFRPDSNMKAWLITILRNHYFSMLRKRSREVEDPEELISGRLSVEPSQELSVEVKEMAHIIQSLPLEQRNALLLVAGYGYSYEEAAKISDCALGTVKSRTSRARKSLEHRMH